ncbi:MAG: ankyrin repeat domain-containing protein [Bacteroidetes bacterium]|nr:ankyrin repeat domain-containing protein [Bacteroidota bacterium]
MKYIFLFILVNIGVQLQAQNNRIVWSWVSSTDTVAIQNLIKLDTPVNHIYMQGRTMLHMAILSDAKATTKWLMQHGANTNIQDADGMTPLHWAISKGDFETVVYLLSFKPNLSLVNHRGESVLHLAAIHKQKEIIKVLLKNGADKYIRDQNDLQPIDYAFDPDLRGLLWIENR